MIITSSKYEYPLKTESDCYVVFLIPYGMKIVDPPPIHIINGCKHEVEYLEYKVQDNIIAGLIPKDKFVLACDIIVNINIDNREQYKKSCKTRNK
jgi:hypothetical protein